MNDNAIENKNWGFLFNEDETFFRKCFKLYTLGEDYVNLSDEEIEKSIVDLNDYKNVASICYLILAGYKSIKLNLLQSLEEGLDRISQKTISPTYNLVYDEMALMGLVIAVKNLKLQQHYEWLKKLLFEYKKSATLRETDYGFAELMEEYINDSNIIVGIQSDKSNLIKSWLSYEKKQENSCLTQQCELSKKIWKMGVPYFNDDFFDCLACGVIDKLIAQKFEFGVISVENNYRKAINKAEKLGKIYAFILISVILITVAVLYIFIVYKISVYEYIKDENLWYIPAGIGVIGVIGLPIAILKNTKKIFLWLSQYFSKLIKKVRGLI